MVKQISFPNLLSQQFATVGGGVFTQPSYEEDVNSLGGILGVPGFGTRRVINFATICWTKILLYLNN